MVASLDGRTLGHFRVERLIGSGGMGAVYEAVDEKLERQVALKVLLQEGDSPTNRKRFLREARLAAKLTHPNIATVFEVGEFESHLYIVMELLEGQALRKLMSGQRLTTDQSIGIARDMARALARAHASGVTHRDIKPENIFITTPTPNVLTAKVLDFGLARQQVSKPKLTQSHAEHTSTETTAPGDILGTPGYWSPEQARAGEVDQRTDIFSFGMVFYEMLTGRPAFKAKATVALVLAVTRHEPEPMRTYVPNIAPQLEELLQRCIAKDPDARFADGSALLAAIEDVARALGRQSRVDDDDTAADKSPPVSPPISEPPMSIESIPVNAPTPGPSTLDEWSSKRIPRIPPERVKLFAAIGAGVAVAGFLLILFVVMWGSNRSSAAVSVEPPPPTTGVLTAVPVSAPNGIVETPPAIATPESEVPPTTVTPTPLAIAAPTAAPAATTTATAARPRKDRKADCAQPFTIDAKGVKIPKLQCL